MQAFPTPREIIEIDSDSASEDFDPSIDDLINFDDVEDDLNNDQDDNETLLRLEDLGEPPDLWTAHIDENTYYAACLAEILEVFPDICHDHVRQIYDAQLQKTADDDLQRANITQQLILQILDVKKYPKDKDRANELKRKRSDTVNSDDEEAARWKDVDRGPDYFAEARRVLLEEFISVPSKFIDLTLKSAGNFYSAYLALELAEYTYLDTHPRPYMTLKVGRRMKTDNAEAAGYGIPELKKEIQAARKQRTKQETKRQAEKDIAAAEAAVDQEHRDNGDILECQCCFDTYPINKITHCDGEEPHLFCLECASSNAKNEIGLSRYALKCMDGSGCSAQFSREQKQRFMDAKSFEALERIQQQAELRLAELKNLSTCPFCEFAAICPPVSVDKEFRCYNPECERITCRLCKLDSHLPLTCQESKKESGISERHVVEEARTLALLRTCPKCQVKILKDDGCNKVVCTCGGMLCDYCGKDISGVGYVHFDGSTGKKCPTYDNFHIRRNKEVERAEAEAQEKVRRENPSIDAEDLKIKFAEATKSPPRKHHHAQVPALGRHGAVPFHFPNRPHGLHLEEMQPAHMVMPAPRPQNPGLGDHLEQVERAYDVEHAAWARHAHIRAAMQHQQQHQEHQQIAHQLDEFHRLHVENNNVQRPGQPPADEERRNQVDYAEHLRRHQAAQFQVVQRHRPRKELMNREAHEDPRERIPRGDRRRHLQPKAGEQRRRRDEENELREELRELEAEQQAAVEARRLRDAYAEQRERLRRHQTPQIQPPPAHVLEGDLPIWMRNLDNEGPFAVPPLGLPQMGLPHHPIGARRGRRDNTAAGKRRAP